jgi:hypothetical protein
VIIIPPVTTPVAGGHTQGDRRRVMLDIRAGRSDRIQVSPKHGAR